MERTQRFNYIYESVKLLPGKADFTSIACVADVLIRFSLGSRSLFSGFVLYFYVTAAALAQRWREARIRLDKPSEK